MIGGHKRKVKLPHQLEYSALHGLIGPEPAVQLPRPTVRQNWRGALRWAVAVVLPSAFLARLLFPDSDAAVLPAAWILGVCEFVGYILWEAARFARRGGPLRLPPAPRPRHQHHHPHHHTHHG